MAERDAVQEVETNRFIVDSNYVAFVMGIVLLTLINSVLWVILRDRVEQTVVLIINCLLSLFLLADAFAMMRRQPDKVAFLFRHRGWMAFAGSLPVPFFGAFRLIRFALSVRYIRRREVDDARRFIITRRATSTLLLVVLLAIIIYETAVLSILSVESGDPQANIQSAGDALWWGFVTISTVGYGDQYPVTTMGRVIGIALIAVGVGLFTSITSFMADWFRQPRASKAEEVLRQATGKPHTGRALLEEVRLSIGHLEQTHKDEMAMLRQQLEELEQYLREDEDENNAT